MQMCLNNFFILFELPKSEFLLLSSKFEVTVKERKICMLEIKNQHNFSERLVAVKSSQRDLKYCNNELAVLLIIH